MLTSLVDLAKESSSDKRRELMGHVASLFVMGAEKYNDEEIALFNGVLKRLVDLVEDRDKEELSEKLCEVRTTPRELVLKLADEDLIISRYMLQYSTVLTLDDLMQLAKIKGQGHLLAISKRERLEARLTDVLIERGEQPVRRSVAANPGAELSNWGTKFLVKIAEKDPVLRESMIHRSDLKPEHFDRLIKQLPEDQGKKMRHLYSSNEKLAEELFHEASNLVAKSKLDRKNSRIDTKGSVREIRSGAKTLDKVFIEHTLSNRLLDLSYLLAELAGLDQKYVLNGFLRSEIDGVAIVCRALEVGEMEFSTFCKARCSILGLPANVAEKWLSDYCVLTVTDAQRALRFIKVRLKALEQPAA